MTDIQLKVSITEAMWKIMDEGYRSLHNRQKDAAQKRASNSCTNETLRKATVSNRTLFIADKPGPSCYVASNLEITTTIECQISRIILSY